MKRLAACAISVAALTPIRAASASPPASLERSTQLVLVTTASWRAVRGALTRYERARPDAAWTRVGRRVPVVVGRRGLGVGVGLVAIDAVGPRKREGDRRAPAGVFALGPSFGLDAPTGIAMPHRRIGRAHRCVDDPRSRHYGRIVDARRAERDWRSAEVLWKLGVASRLAVVVQHNAARTPGAGSCIFLHPAKVPLRATVGCTAMALSQLRALARWLDPKRHPLLVQLPRALWKDVRGALGFASR